MKLSRISKGIPIGAELIVADNSVNIKTAKLIGVINKGGHKRRLNHARIGDIVVVARSKKMHHAIVIRTKMGVYRATQDRYYRYEDNAIAIIDFESRKLKGTSIKGVICKEVFSRFAGMTSLRARVV